MTKPQWVLNNLLNEINLQEDGSPLSPLKFHQLTDEELADLFVDLGFIGSSIKFITEEKWLQKKDILKKDLNFQNFIAPLFGTELSPIQYLQNEFERSSLETLKEFASFVAINETSLVTFIKSKNPIEQKVFLSTCLSRMVKLFEFENSLQLQKATEGRFLGLSLYRTFDALDEILNLKYENDHGMKTDLENKERLYEGAGAGVQSGYSTVLLALQNLNPAHGSRFVDLGSGYGRVGLIIGLLRPDIFFEGYEYVPHRVENSRLASEIFGLQDHVKFYAQDLSSIEFKIPEAEIYYLYDPFSEETYGHVLNQIVAHSKNRKISIVTKGNARSWLLEIAAKEGWASPQEFDNRNLCLFKS